MNVNHTVDSAEPDDGTEEAPEMKSKPNFEVGHGVNFLPVNGKTLHIDDLTDDLARHH